MDIYYYFRWTRLHLSFAYALAKKAMTDNKVLPEYDYDMAEYDIRVFVEWTEHGCWFNSTTDNFHALLVKHTKEWGPPNIVEFRDKKDWLPSIKWIKVDGGNLFEGTLDQFKDCFFDNADPSTISAWAQQHNYKCEITYHD